MLVSVNVCRHFSGVYIHPDVIWWTFTTYKSLKWTLPRSSLSHTSSHGILMNIYYQISKTATYQWRIHVWYIYLLIYHQQKSTIQKKANIPYHTSIRHWSVMGYTWRKHRSIAGFGSPFVLKDFMSLRSHLNSSYLKLFVLQLDNWMAYLNI